MSAATKRERTRATFELFRLLPLMMAVQQAHNSYGIGRVPSLDDVCSECEFELGRHRATPTFAYIVTEEITYTVKEAAKGGKFHIAKKKRNVWHEVHWCSRHQHEVIPLRNGVVHAARSTIALAFEEAGFGRSHAHVA